MKTILIYTPGSNSFIENNLKVGWNTCGEVTIFAGHSNVGQYTNEAESENEIQKTFSEKISQYLSPSLKVLLVTGLGLFSKIYVYLSSGRHAALIEDLKSCKVAADKVVFFIMDTPDATKKKEYLRKNGYEKADVVLCSSGTVDEIEELIKQFKKEA